MYRRFANIAKAAATILPTALAAFALNAQTPPRGDALQETDAVEENVPVCRVDSLLVGQDIVKHITDGNGIADMDIIESPSIHRERPAGTMGKASGYRVRIFFSNARDAREKSLAAVESFKGRFPDCPSYRNYDSPNFKVTVGDFISKSEASHILEEVKYMFPSAFIVSEEINLPY